jgi:hypothetical protein
VPGRGVRIFLLIELMTLLFTSITCLCFLLCPIVESSLISISCTVLSSMSIILHVVVFLFRMEILLLLLLVLTVFAWLVLPCLALSVMLAVFISMALVRILSSLTKSFSVESGIIIVTSFKFITQSLVGV